MVFSNALIGLREGLEAALVVVILVAFPGQDRPALGVEVGLGGRGRGRRPVCRTGCLLDLRDAATLLRDPELIGGTASIIAVAFMTGMVFWMRSAARTISGELKVRWTRPSPSGLPIALVGFLGVGREGLETAIFFYATAEAAGAGTAQPLLGWIIGIGSACIPRRADVSRGDQDQPRQVLPMDGDLPGAGGAGILAYGIHDLQGSRLPARRTRSPSTSPVVIAPDGWLGTLLKGTLNFTPATTWLRSHLLGGVCRHRPALPAPAKPTVAEPTRMPAQPADAGTR